MHEVASDIIISTTEVDPKTNLLALFALEAQMHTVAEVGDGYEQFVIGSVADLNLKALLQCDNDINIMAQSIREIAIPIGCKLPGDEYLRRLNRKNVSLYRMQPTEDPGYVYLLTDGSLEFLPHTNPAKYAYKPDQNSGIFVQQHKNFSKSTKFRTPGATFRRQFQHISSVSTNSSKMHGKKFVISSDSVKSIPCPYWCSNDFSERRRPHDWPMKDTVTEIVRKGCDLVLASDVSARRRSDTNQWRLSFSRAETLLIQTWTPAQRIVYHLLRYLRKKCLPIACLISSYHLKTLMLWNCEKQPHSYWEANVIAISSDLLGRLLKHINDRYLPNYFIPQSNLFELRTVEGDSFGSSYVAVVATLTPFTLAETLGKWFLENYIKVAAKQFYGTKSASMADDLLLINHLDITELMTWLTAFVDTFLTDYNQQKSMETSVAVNSYVKKLVEFCAGGKIVPDVCRKILDQLPQIDIRSLDVFRSVVFMEAASQTYQFGLGLMEHSIGSVVEVMIRSGKIDRSEFDQCEGDSALSNFKRATSLLCFVRCPTGVDDKLLLALSKAYFWKSLLCADSGPVYCAVNAYLAAIFYQGKETKLALYCCTLIVSKDEHKSCSGYTIQPQLLPIINSVLSASKTEKESKSVSYKDVGQLSPTDPLSPETFANRLLLKIDVDSERCRSYEGKDTSSSPDIHADTISSLFFTDDAKKPNSSSIYVASKKSVGLETLLFVTDLGISSNVSQSSLGKPGNVDSQASCHSPTKSVGVSHKSKSNDHSYVSERSTPMNKSEELESLSSTGRSGNRITIGIESALGSISTKTIIYMRTEHNENVQRFQYVGSPYRKHTEMSSESESEVLPEGTVTFESNPKVVKHQKRGREMVYCREQLSLAMYLNRAMRSPQNIYRKREAYSNSRGLRSTLYSRTENHAHVHVSSPADSDSACGVLKLKENDVSDENEVYVDQRSPNTSTYFDHNEANPDSYSSRNSKSTSSQLHGLVATTIRQDVVSALVKASVCHMTAFNKALQNDPDVSQHEHGAYPYMALYHFKSGHFQAALKICNDMLNLEYIQSSNSISFNVICSPPFNLLLTHDLAMIVNECRSSSEIMIINARFLAAYLSIQCLMNLDRSVVEIARILMQAYAFLLRSHSPFEEVNSKIYVLLRENVLQRYRGVITEDHGNDSLSVLENGTLTRVGIRQEEGHIVLYTELHGGRDSRDLFSNINENYVSDYDRYTM